jgi:hypothetical protein
MNCQTIEKLASTLYHSARVGRISPRVKPATETMFAGHATR